MILDKIKELLAEKADIDTESVTAETKFSDLGIDSLDIVELLMNIEDEFGVNIEPDESLATVDIASIDLYTGQTELYKAGAAPTVIRRSGRTGKAESSSLPAGILREIGFDKAAIKCRIGDIVVMMSDGAVTEGTDWIRDEIESWTDGSAQELAERLCEGAKRRRTDNHEDDITVMTAILNKAV